MDSNQCKTCKYFLQHYTLRPDKLIEVHRGHCTYLRASQKLPDSKACKNYVPRKPMEDAFVSKEYLSKALLQKVLCMALLPEVEHRG